MKRGDKFAHAFWLDENRQPLQCEVSAIRHGHIYWKREGGTKSEGTFPIADAGKYAKPEAKANA